MSKIGMIRSRLLALRTLGLCALGLFLMLGASGCAALTFRIKGTPAATLPAACRAPSKRNLVPIDFSKLAQPQPAAYRVDRGDVLGVYIEGTLPYYESTEIADPPPVHFRVVNENLPPALGVPVIVEDNGMITLPSVGQVAVAGLTLDEVAQRLRSVYDQARLLRSDKTQPVITLVTQRAVNVTVIREDTGATLQNEHQGTGGVVRLAAYKNDVLNALMATGGLPGLRAKNEIRILRHIPQVDALGAPLEITGLSRTVRPGCLESCGPMPGTSETIIPLLIQCGSTFEIRPEDILLNEGDIVFIANRDTEVFYTGGLLPGGEHLLPRDRDIDVFEAMAIAGASYARPGATGGGIASVTGVVPSQLFVLREQADGTQYTIEVDLERAIANENERLLVAPGDKLLLRYKPQEEALNFGIFAFFTYGLRQLLK